METKKLHSLIPLADFKAITGIDDRDDALCRYCLITSTYTIEEYCHREILKKKRVEFLEFTEDFVFPLKDYPVRTVLAVAERRVRDLPSLSWSLEWNRIPLILTVSILLTLAIAK
jgi:hypothetical protein